MQKTYSKEQGAFYDSFDKPQSYYRSVSKSVEKYLSFPVLDIGGNDGSLLDQFSVKGASFIVDMSLASLISAKKKGYFVCMADMHQLPFKERTFNTILMINTLEHSPDPVQLLQSLKNILRAEGKLIIDVPNARSIRQLLNLAVSGNPLPSGNSITYSKIPQHYFQYSPHLLEEVIKLAGYKKAAIFGKPPIKKPFSHLSKLIHKSVLRCTSTDIIAIVEK